MTSTGTRTPMQNIDYEPLASLGGPDDPNRILMSFHYCRTVGRKVTRYHDFKTWLELNWPAGTRHDVFADSGGFSAHSLGKIITVDDYAAWVNRFGEYLTTIVGLDAIRDPEVTRANYDRLRQLTGRDVVPIYHAGTDDNWAAFDRYLDDGVTYLALGGMVGQPSGAVLRWVVEAHRRAAGRAVFHGFGLTSWKLIRDLPWYSVDSSSWTQAMRFGTLRLYDPRHHRWELLRIPKHDHDARNYPVTRDVAASVWHCADVLREVYDVDPRRLLPEQPIPDEHWSSWSGAHTNALSAKSYRVAEQYLRERHGPIVRPGVDNDEAGLRMYLACSPVWPPGFAGPTPGFSRVGLTIEEPTSDQRTADVAPGDPPAS